MNRVKVFAPLACALTLFIAACSQPQDLRAGLEPQFGTALYDEARAVATDNARGRVYVAGIESSTQGSRTPGYVFLRRLDTSGTFMWSAKLESETELYADFTVTGAEVDATGNIYVAWYIYDSEGGTYGPGRLAKVSSSGRVLYTVNLNSNEGVGALEVDPAGNAYVAIGLTADRYREGRAFLRKYDTQGRMMWERKTLYRNGEPISDPQNIPAPKHLGLTPDGTLFVLGDEDLNDNVGIVLTRYSSTGRTLGQTALPRADSGQLTTSGNAVYTFILKTPELNFVLQQRDLSGAVVWERTTPVSFARDGINDLAGDGSGNAYLTGFRGVPASDGGGLESSDVLALKYASSGVPSWTYAPRTEANDDSFGIAAQSNGNAYLVGSTSGKVSGVNRGSYDAFITKLSSNGRFIWTR